MTATGQGEYLYSFAVITDTHLNQSDVDCNSPFDVNRRANNRLRYVIEDLNRREIALVIHLGDVVHPVPSMDQLYHESSRRFFEQFDKLKHPFFIIPGNHDVGDKPLAWGPSGSVRDDFLQAWSEHFGAHYFHHQQDEVHFIGINAQLLGSSLAMEQEQKQWLQALLEDKRGQRIFLHSHYPPYLYAVDEDEHYDNLAEPGRSWFLSLLQEYQVEALFCGHVHQYWFNRHAQTQCHLLPSTAFTRQDYSEMFRVASGDEFGRNDEQKLGYMLVHLYQRGHGVEIVRSGGRELEADDVASPALYLDKKPGFAAFKSRLGFDLRQDWFESVLIPPSGGLDEFDRKRVRNDYGLLALLDMGIRRLRLPPSDLLQPERRQRLLDLQAFGFEQRFYSFGAPDASLREVILAYPQLVDQWEICCGIEQLGEIDAEFFSMAKQQGITLLFSPLRSKQEVLDSGKTYYHVINHGFTLQDEALLGEWLKSESARHFDNYGIRLAFDEDVVEVAAMAKRLYQQVAIPASIMLRLGANNPAQFVDDDAWQCRRLAEALLLGQGSKACEFYCDSLADSDRGYLPHAGVVDRRYNPRAGMRVVQHINSLLQALPGSREPAVERLEQVTLYHMGDVAQPLLVCLPQAPVDAVNIARRWQQGRDSDNTLRFVDLASGRVTALEQLFEFYHHADTELPFALLK